MCGPVVDTYLGKLQGKFEQDSNCSYYSFQGVPYAKPPKGDLRFKPPQPPEPWSGIRDATAKRNVCCQRSAFSEETFGSEDCLYLNVYTKHLPDGSDANRIPKPVIAWIDGGDSSHERLPDCPLLLLEEDVVLIAVSYRLGMLGFLSLEDPQLGVSGNAGLKDQLMALEWIRKCARSFGGDPFNVTVFGHGLDGACAHYLMLTKRTKGLFNKMIIENGCALNPWSMGTRCSDRLMAALHLQTTSEKTLLETLTNASIEEIVRVQEEIVRTTKRRVFSPVVERQSETINDALLLDHPLDIIQRGAYNKVPLMIGYIDRELGTMKSLNEQNEEFFNVDSIDFEDVIPFYVNLERGSELSMRAAARIKEFYFGKRRSATQLIYANYLMRSDVNYLRGIFSTVRNHAKTSTVPVYFYKVVLANKFELFKKFAKVCLQGEYVDQLLQQSSISEAACKMVKFWSGFAKYGDPNPLKKDRSIKIQWTPATRYKINHLSVEYRLKMHHVDPLYERMRFWDELLAINSAIDGMQLEFQGNCIE